MVKEPLISVNISCLNRSAMLRECVESFLTQTFTDFELIIVDDGSTEDLSFVEQMDPRIRFFKQEHGGMAKGLNLAAKHSVGDYIMPFGSDDLALPELLQELFSFIGLNPTADMVYCDGFIRNGRGQEIRRKHPMIADINQAYKKMLEAQYITHGGTLWRRSSMPNYDETVGSAEDWEFFLTALEWGLQFRHLERRLWVYRIGHKREGGSDSQNMGCEKVLNRRGYTFDKFARRGKKVCS